MPEYTYERQKVKREDTLNIPTVAIGVTVETLWSVEEQQDYVVAEYLVPAGGSDE